MSLRSKLVALAAAAVVAISVVPAPALAAVPETFVTDAYANHWGRSDLRAYLNGYTKTSLTGPLNSTTTGGNSSGYAAQFSPSEYDLIQPATYSTNVLDANGDAASVYETTDRFYLPSGNYGNNRVLYWGSEDISANSVYAAAAQYDIARFIPVSYWSGGADNRSYLRSAAPYSSNALTSRRDSYVGVSPVYGNAGAAPIMKVNINNVSFAAAASAAELAVDGNSGSKAITIAGSSDFGHRASGNLPDYGMYLKTLSTSKFQPMNVQLVSNTLSVTYSGGVQGQYVVVQAYEEDSLGQGTTVYAAAARIDRDSGSVDIDVASWGLPSLDGYTVKVWMEDASNGSSLASATEPVTFVGNGGAILQTDAGAVENPRVFATVDKLQTSWGDLSDLGANVGANPTNQKIYFGEKDDQPLQFWIAGRETAATGGEISTDGSTLVLYQAKSVDEQQFNKSAADYDVVSTGAVILMLVDGETLSLSDGSVTYPVERVTFRIDDDRQGIDGPQNKDVLSWQYRATTVDAWKDGMPSTAGVWQVRCCATGVDAGTGNRYETTYSAPVTLTVEKGTPAANDFNFTAPSGLTYDGTPKKATVTAKLDVAGMGGVAVRYVDTDGNELGAAPTDAGTYTVKIDVAEGSAFAAATGLTDHNWTFTIAKAGQAAPTGFTVVDETAAGAANGSVSGLPANAEWRAQGASSWTSVVPGSGITGLAPGSYEVRLAGDKNHEPSPAASFEVRPFSAAHGGADVPEGPEAPAAGKNDGLAKTSDPAALLASATLAAAGAVALLVSRRK